MLSPEHEAESKRRNAGFMVENVFTEPVEVDRRQGDPQQGSAPCVHNRRGDCAWKSAPDRQHKNGDAAQGAEACGSWVELDANQKTVRGKKQPRRWRRPATLTDFGRGTIRGWPDSKREGDPSDKSLITTQEIDLRWGNP